MSAFVSNHRADDQGFVPFILQIHLCHRDVELAMQTRDQGLNASALFFEGRTGRDVEVNGEGSPVPAMKLKQLKEFVRQRAKEKKLPAETLNQLKSVLE